MNKPKQKTPFMPVPVPVPAAPTFGVGQEVQFKANPGVGYRVLDVVKNEHALKALNNSGMAIGLTHELEPYFDIEQAAFIKKTMQIWETDGENEIVDLEILAANLWDAGARFPESYQTNAVPQLDNRELVAMTCDVARKIASYSGFNAQNDSDENWVRKYRDRHPRMASVFAMAMQIMELTRNAEVADAMDEVFPLDEEEF